MILLEAHLAELDAHWAVSAVPVADRARAHELANARLVRGALGEQLKLEFASEVGDDALLERVAMAYELAAVEGLGVLLEGAHEDTRTAALAQAGAFRAFELTRAFAIPTDVRHRLFFILRLAAYAYVGDRWSDLRRWLLEYPEKTAAPSAANVDWDERVLFRIYECWLRLFRKDSWNDLHGIAEVVAGLREEQRDFEETVLGNHDPVENRAMALRLVALYHWAKATEQLGKYMLQGQPSTIAQELEQHFEKAIEAAGAARDLDFEILLRWLHVVGRRMVANSLWFATRTINSRVSRFVRALTSAAHPMIELLPPQRAAIAEKGLLDPAAHAVVVDLPTSGGKTTLAQFRILQALNQFADDKGWVAYVAPTRALVAQITRKLRRDFSSIGVRVEQVSGGVEIDTIESELLKQDASFDILVSTPEKLSLLVRNGTLSHRPLALIVVDEAHNIEDEQRGLRVELLLATVRQDCPKASYLLLTPFVPQSRALARWLDPENGKPISLSTTAWKPNERIVGLFSMVEDSDDGPRTKRKWRLRYETALTTPKTIHLKGVHDVGDWKPLRIGADKAERQHAQAAAMAKVFSTRGTSIAVGSTIPRVWSMARSIAANVEAPAKAIEEIELVRSFLKTEIGDDFELVSLLDKRVAVHHAGLPEEARTLVEWLTEEGHLRVLCATTTIAQGINFPVSSVFLATRFHQMKHRSVPMSYREFWNLAGRAGRVQQDSVGVVGLALKKGEDGADLRKFLASAAEDLASRLLALLDGLVNRTPDEQLRVVIRDEQWADFRSFIAHLLREAGDLNQLRAQSEKLLRSTFGYSLLRASDEPGAKEKARTLVAVTNAYAERLAANMGTLNLADSTGFDPEGVQQAMAGLHHLENRLTPHDWAPQRLFGDGSQLSSLVGLMMTLPNLKPLTELAGTGQDRERIADIAKAWIGGEGIREIALRYFEGKTPTDKISDACRGVYRSLANYGVWGLAALSKLPGSGIDWDSLSDEQRRSLNLLPAFMYHGVRTEEAVLMRMNQVPRSIASEMGTRMRRFVGHSEPISVSDARQFVKSLTVSEWEEVRPTGSTLAGSQYRAIWQQLSGEAG